MLGKKASVKVISQELKQYQVNHTYYTPYSIFNDASTITGSRCLYNSVCAGADTSLGSGLVL